MIVTEQSHVFNFHWCCISISKVIPGLCILFIRPLVVSVERLSFRMPKFVAFGSCLVYLISVRSMTVVCELCRSIWHFLLSAMNIPCIMDTAQNGL